MNNFFWDTSAIVKLIHYEKYTPLADEVFFNFSNNNHASILSLVETRRSLRPLYRQAESEKHGKTSSDPNILYLSYLRLEQFVKTTDKVISELKLIGLDDEILGLAAQLVITNEIRSMDAIILATCKILASDLNNLVFASADKKQLKVAEKMGIGAIKFTDA